MPLCRLFLICSRELCRYAISACWQTKVFSVVCCFSYLFLGVLFFFVGILSRPKKYHPSSVPSACAAQSSQQSPPCKHAGKHFVPKDYVGLVFPIAATIHAVEAALDRLVQSAGFRICCLQGEMRRDRTHATGTRFECGALQQLGAFKWIIRTHVRLW